MLTTDPLNDNVTCWEGNLQLLELLLKKGRSENVSLSFDTKEKVTVEVEKATRMFLPYCVETNKRIWRWPEQTQTLIEEISQRHINEETQKAFAPMRLNPIQYTKPFP